MISESEKLIMDILEFVVYLAVILVLSAKNSWLKKLFRRPVQKVY